VPNPTLCVRLTQVPNPTLCAQDLALLPNPTLCARLILLSMGAGVLLAPEL